VMELEEKGLLSCPFCGSKPSSNQHGKSLLVWCPEQNCPANDLSVPANAWNTRHGEANLAHAGKQEAPCPYIVTGGEGSCYCRLAEQHGPPPASKLEAVDEYSPPCPDIEPIRAIARECGYAVGVHGSLKRDFDLIAAPWADQAVAYNVLVERLCEGLPSSPPA